HSNQGTALNGPAAGFHMLAGSTFFGRGALAAATADTQGLVVEAGARLVASGTLNTGRMPIFVRGGTVEAQGGFGFNFEGPVSFTNARFLANG
ncbi:hypothetical protein, partial [Streptomyces europaeiscabiei]|uniref:hypothetical protein n=1 Tax=Streptomyces europaeiscabiei TaxID=146819 RepID=UPI0038F7BA60